MENKQAVDYIREQLAAGHTEANLRAHFVQYGWAEAAVDEAFKHYHKNMKSAERRSAAKKLRRGGKQKLVKWTKRRQVKLVLTGLAVIVLVIVTHTVITRPHKPAPVAAAPLTYQQKQNIDVNTIAGAVGQYAYANNVLPTRLSVGSGTLIMCDTTCDPTTSQISPLSVYKPTDVKIEPYVAGLTVPDDQTVYLVPLAKCQNQTSLGTPSLNQRSMVLLYASSSGSSISQRCVTL
jgi:hypothetical protein